MAASTNDEDHVRAAGLVAVSFGRLEDAARQLLNHCETLFPIPDKIRRKECPLRKKSKCLDEKLGEYLISRLGKNSMNLNIPDLEGGNEATPIFALSVDSFKSTMKQCISLIDARNDIMHSPVYPTEEDESKVVRISDKTGIGEVMPAELENLAHDIGRMTRQIVFLRVAIELLKMK